MEDFVENTGILDKRKKNFVNSALIAVLLIVSAHFSAPFIYDIVAFSVNKVKNSPMNVLNIFSCSLTEENSWKMILSILPQFLFGFEVETILSSFKYFKCLVISSIISNTITLVVSYSINIAYPFISYDYKFASTSPILFFSLLSFSLHYTPEIHFLSKYKNILNCSYFVTYFVFAFRSHYIQLIHLIVSIMVNSIIVVRIDPSIKLYQVLIEFIPSGVSKIFDAARFSHLTPQAIVSGTIQGTQNL